MTQVIAASTSIQIRRQKSGIKKKKEERKKEIEGKKNRSVGYRLWRGKDGLRQELCLVCMSVCLSVCPPVCLSRSL